MYWLDVQLLDMLDTLHALDLQRRALLPHAPPIFTRPERIVWCQCTRCVPNEQTRQVCREQALSRRPMAASFYFQGFERVFADLDLPPRSKSQPEDDAQAPPAYIDAKDELQVEESPAEVCRELLIDM